MANIFFLMKNPSPGHGSITNRLTTPRRLQHGDVLHIGRLSYRFMLRKPPERPAPQVIPTEEMIRTPNSPLEVAAVTHPGMAGRQNEDRFAVSSYRVSET